MNANRKQFHAYGAVAAPQCVLSDKSKISIGIYVAPLIKPWSVYALQTP